METKNNYSAGDAKFAARKVLKAFKNHDLTSPRLADHLSTLLLFAEENHLSKLRGKIQKVVSFLLCIENGNHDETLNLVEGISEEICGINEKRRVMDIRQKQAAIQFRNILNMSDVREHTATLKPYDVVKVPTMGGMHYSIISEVNEDYITCFPMTSASRKDLELVGVRSVSLSDCGEKKYDGIRLSAAATTIPIEEARKADYFGNVANNATICEIMEKVVAFA